MSRWGGYFPKFNSFIYFFIQVYLCYSEYGKIILFLHKQIISFWYSLKRHIFLYFTFKYNFRVYWTLFLVQKSRFTDVSITFFSLFNNPISCNWSLMLQKWTPFYFILFPLVTGFSKGMACYKKIIWSQENILLQNSCEFFLRLQAF